MRWTGHILMACMLMGVGLAAAGCGGTREVEASRPRAYQPNEEPPPESAGQARVRVFIQQGETDLPEDIQQLSFRTAEVRLRTSAGEWVRLPSDAGAVELERNRGALPRLVLDTRIAPATYDSMEIGLSHVFVRFNENSGGPLTTASDTPQRLAFDLEAALDVATTIHLRLEPEPSLRRTQDCRWFFVPVFRPAAVSDAGETP